MTETAPFSAQFRADLFRIVCRFASMSDGVRVEPAGVGKGVVLTAWTDEAVFAVRDVNGWASDAALLRVPHEFIEATARTLRDARDAHSITIGVAGGEVWCTGVSLRASRCVFSAPADNWRAAARLCAYSPLVGGVELRRDVVATIGDAARWLARAAGSSAFEAERASYRLRGGDELGSIVVEFDSMADAFAIVRRAGKLHSDDDTGKWEPPLWIEDAPQAALGAASRQ